MTPHEPPPIGKQLPLFVDAIGEGAFVYVVSPDGLTWSVRKWSDGEEIFTRDERGAAKHEAEARGYIIKK